MSSNHDPTVLPAGLPAPKDDGACLHLRGMPMPSIDLACTDGSTVTLSSLAGPAVLFFYPRTGIPGKPPTLGFGGEDWDSIPGARGCTPQSCGFRDLYNDFTALGVRVFGVSTNTIAHQREFRGRMHIPYHFLSDSALQTVRAMNLPTFRFPVDDDGPTIHIHRMAWFVEQDPAGTPRVRRVFYPVFPPDKNASEVLEWLSDRRDTHIERRGPRHDAYLDAELRKHWLTPVISSRGIEFHADRLPAFIAVGPRGPAGQVTMAFEEHGSAPGECEVITLSSTDHSRGTGSLLMDAAEDEARARGCLRLFLTTTNDNLNALRFYQRRGMRVSAVYPGMIDRYRRKLPGIPRVGSAGIPLRDEIELELKFA